MVKFSMLQKLRLGVEMLWEAVSLGTPEHCGDSGVLLSVVAHHWLFLK